VSPADWIGLINGALLLALTVKAFYGWVFGREHNEQNLGHRVGELEEKYDKLDELCRRHVTDIALLKAKARARG
jgi:hypothetical protein